MRARTPGLYRKEDSRFARGICFRIEFWIHVEFSNYSFINFI